MDVVNADWLKAQREATRAQSQDYVARRRLAMPMRYRGLIEPLPPMIPTPPQVVTPFLRPSRGASNAVPNLSANAGRGQPSLAGYPPTAPLFNPGLQRARQPALVRQALASIAAEAPRQMVGRDRLRTKRTAQAVGR